MSLGTLSFVLLGGLIALFWFELRDGKRHSKKKKPESTVI
jgi:hypothetical protein